MLVVSTREFRANQSMYFDLVDKNEQVIVQRGKNKSYAVTPITDDDRYFADPKIIERIKHSIQQANNGEGVVVTKENQRKFLGLE
jgi:cell fate regulator YaaT (PSP1 superfamily)